MFGPVASIPCISTVIVREAPLGNAARGCLDRHRLSLAAAHRADDLPVPGDRHLRPGVARDRALGSDDRDEHDPARCLRRPH